MFWLEISFDKASLGDYINCDHNMCRLQQRFSTQITSQPVFPITYNFWTVDGKTKSLEHNFTPLLYPPFKKEIWRLFKVVHITKKIIIVLLTNFVSVEDRKVFFNIPLLFCGDPLKIFQVPLLGRDLAVEKPWFTVHSNYSGCCLMWSLWDRGKVITLTEWKQ
jgi:hypothetical protein